MKNAGIKIQITLLLIIGLLFSFGCQREYEDLPKFLMKQTGVRSYEISINGRIYSTIENPIWYPEEYRQGEAIGTSDFNGTVLVYRTSTENCVHVENQKSSLTPTAELFSNDFIQPKLGETEITSIRYETYANRYQDTKEYIEITDAATIKKTVLCITDDEAVEKINTSESKLKIEWVGVVEFRSSSLLGMVATFRIIQKDGRNYFVLGQSGSDLICIDGQEIIPPNE